MTGRVTYGRDDESAIDDLAAGLRARLAADARLTGVAGEAFDLVPAARDLVEREAAVLDRETREELARRIVVAAVGLGPLEPLLADPTVDEVMVNGPNSVWVERRGRLEPTDVRFADAAELENVIDRILAPVGRRVDHGSPLCDARLPDGSRVNVVIPPLALGGPNLTVRRFSRSGLTASDLVNRGTLSRRARDFLAGCVAARVTILVSGGTGSGKTTTLNALSEFVGEDERIITIEDAAELRLRQRHVVRLESRPANIEGRGEVTIRMLVRNALRMRPDRIVVGEVRGGEALDMLAAMTTGHDGSLATVHASGPLDALVRVETLALMGGVDVPYLAIRAQTAGAIDLVVHQGRLRDGNRVVSRICEVVGRAEDGYVVHDLMTLGDDGERWSAPRGERLIDPWTASAAA